MIEVDYIEELLRNYSMIKIAKIRKTKISDYLTKNIIFFVENFPLNSLCTNFKNEGNFKVKSSLKDHFYL
jgi:hypothetical protein